MDSGHKDETYVVCPRCKGYGANHNDAPDTHCHLCGGDGLVWETTEGYYRRRYQRRDTAVMW